MPNNSRHIIQLIIKLFKSRDVEFCRSMHSLPLNINNNEARKWKLLMKFVSYTVNLIWCDEASLGNLIKFNLSFM
jgi:hypothetical protein